MIDSFLQLLQNKYIVLTTKFLAALAIIIAIYSFYKSDQASLKYEILLNQEIIDVKEEVDNLNVLYDSINVIEDNFQISSIIIRVINDGNKSLTTNLYDQNFLPGIEFENSRILSFSIPRASNEYLLNATNPSQTDSSSLRINPVIFDSGEYFDIKFLLLHPDSITLFPRSLGKVANVPSIKIVEKFTADDNTLRKITVGGGFKIQLIRLVFYSFIFICLMILILGIISPLLENYFKKKRTEEVQNFLKKNKLYSELKSDIIFENYISNHEVDNLKDIVLKIKFLSIALQSNDTNNSIAIMSALMGKNKDLKIFSKILNNEIPEHEKEALLKETDTFNLRLVEYSEKNGLIINQERSSLLTDFYNFIIQD
ncbi:MAG: hypothetical protein JXR20_01940 [Balneola sp.]